MVELTYKAGDPCVNVDANSPYFGRWGIVKDAYFDPAAEVRLTVYVRYNGDDETLPEPPDAIAWLAVEAKSE